jgi:hypothetical protein
MDNNTMYDESVNYIKSYRNPDERTRPLENQLSKLVSKEKIDFRSITEMLIRNYGKNRETRLLSDFLAIM